MTRSTLRGPGSNQHQDKAPLPPRDADVPSAAVPSPGVDPLGDDHDWNMLREHPSLVDIRDRYAEADIPLHVVGGPVRDLIAEGHPGDDLDLCSPADVDTTKSMLDDLGAVPDTGQEFGTVKLFREGHPTVEVTTFRSEAYRDDSRKPDVFATTSLEEDLSRRDFTVNAMAYDLTTGELNDPFGGQADLEAGLLRAVGDPEQRFIDDPLRIVRLARFAAVRDWDAHPDTAAAARSTAGRLDIVAPERVLTETRKVLANDDPHAFKRYLEHLNDLGVADRVLPGVNLDAAASGHPQALSSTEARLGYLAAHCDNPSSSFKKMKASSDEATTATTVAQVADVLGADDLDQVAVRRAIRHNAPAIIDAAVEVNHARNRPTAAVSAHGLAADRLRAPLPVDGNDGLSAGLKGRDIGTWLRRVEDEFLTRYGDLTREQALALVPNA